MRVRSGTKSHLQPEHGTQEIMLPDDGSLASQAQRFGTLEYRDIPWSHGVRSTQDDSITMTVNLALWWLHTMAAESNGIKKRYPLLRNLERIIGVEETRYPPSPMSLETTPDRPHGKKLPVRSTRPPSVHFLTERNKGIKCGREEVDLDDAARRNQQPPGVQQLPARKKRSKRLRREVELKESQSKLSRDWWSFF